MKTSVTELGDSRVRIDAEVDASEVEEKLKSAAESLGREMKIPGFREGKVPAEMVLQRAGREAVLQEALQSSLAEWYERAMLDAGVNPVGEPELKLDELPEDGQPLQFAIEVGVRPKAKLGNYKDLEVGKTEPEVPPDALEAELNRLREGFANLTPVEREAKEGDMVVIDYRGEVDGEPFEGGEAKDQMVELGAGRLLEQFEQALVGATAGDELEVKVTFPDDYKPEDLAGKEATFAITVKEVREKQLPELNDEFAAEASEFETLDELRGEIESRIKHALEHQADDAFRAAAVDAAAVEASVDLPDELVTARAKESWSRLARQLATEGMDPQSFLQFRGKTEDEMIAEAKPAAEQSLKREAVLEAIAEAENIEVSDEELLDVIRPAAERDGKNPESVLAGLRSEGRDAVLREDMRMRKAVDVVASSAKPIPAEQADAREKIWTPEKEREEKGGLWTPGDPGGPGDK
jgi:trigger factor